MGTRVPVLHTVNRTIVTVDFVIHQTIVGVQIVIYGVKFNYLKISERTLGITTMTNKLK